MSKPEKAQTAHPSKANRSTTSMHDNTEASPEKPDIPKFGLIDMVDAFTAFRHEYRTQAKESRVTAELLQTVSQQLAELTTSLRSPSPQLSQAHSRAFKRTRNLKPTAS